MRVKRGVKARKRRNRTLERAKGFRGRSKNTIRQATARVEKAMVYAYRDRRAKKRAFRELWIVRIAAAARAAGMSYSRFMSGVKKAGLEMDRKVLADMAARNPKDFQAIVEVARAAV